MPTSIERLVWPELRAFRPDLHRQPAVLRAEGSTPGTPASHRVPPLAWAAAASFFVLVASFFRRCTLHVADVVPHWRRPDVYRARVTGSRWPAASQPSSGPWLLSPVPVASRSNPRTWICRVWKVQNNPCTARWPFVSRAASARCWGGFLLARSAGSRDVRILGGL